MRIPATTLRLVAQSSRRCRNPPSCSSHLLPLALRGPSLRSRSIHSSPIRHDSGSPTKLHNILEGGIAPAVQVRSVTQGGGIELQDGLIIPGACIFLDGQVFMWRVPLTTVDSDGHVRASGRSNNALISAWSAPGWSKAHFEVFEVVVPKPEILLLGTGRTVSHPPPSIRSYLNSIGIQVDVLDTWNACTTYNLLAEEGRRVAAALLPLAGAQMGSKTA